MSSWFISPWEAVRFSLEAQRLIALQLFPFAPRQEQRRQEVASDDKGAFVTPQNAFVTPQNIGSSAHVIGSSAQAEVPPQAKKTPQARTVAASKATELIRKAGKTKSVKARRKSSRNRKRA